MKLLLDTHAVIWWWSDRQKLPVGVKGAIEAEAETVFVSSVSAWEIATKVRAGKLLDMAPFIARYDATMAESRFSSLAIIDSHALAAGSYPAAHRDPFDRMLAAQAELEDLILVTRDPAFAAFPCRTLW